MSDLVYVSKDKLICSLVEEMPAFLAFNLNVGQVLEIVMGDLAGYVDQIDMNWLTLVYRLHHAEVLDWTDLDFGALVDRDYEQQAVNFVMAATLNWSQKFCEAYANSGKLSEMVGNCEVLQFDRHKVRVH